MSRQFETCSKQNRAEIEHLESTGVGRRELARRFCEESGFLRTSAMSTSTDARGFSFSRAAEAGGPGFCRLPDRLPYISGRAR